MFELLKVTKGVGKSIARWLEQLPSELGSTFFDHASHVAAFEGFCSMAAGLPGLQQAATEAKLGTTIVEALSNMAGTCLPQTWGKAANDFNEKLLTSNEALKQRINGETPFLPACGVAMAAFWQELDMVTEPKAEYDILSKMAPILNREKDMTVHTKAFMMNKVRVHCVSFMCTHYTSIDPQLKLKELSQQAGFAVEALKVMKLHVEDTGNVVQSYLRDHLMPAIFGLVSTAFQDLDSAVAAIPGNWEKLINDRNIVSIKNTLFQRETHNQVCGKQQDIQNLSTAFFAGVKVWCSLGLVSSSQCLDF